MKSSGTTQPELENLRGLALMLNGDAKGALPLFEKAMPLPEARFNRAVALLKLARYAEASAEFEKMWAGSSDPAARAGLENPAYIRASAAYHDALALDALGRSNDAMTWLTRALEVDPNFDSALLYLGVLRERAGDMQGAGKAYKQFLDRHPDSIVAMLRFGVAAQRAGHPETARKYFEKIVAAVPSSPEAAEARMYLEMWE